MLQNHREPTWNISRRYPSLHHQHLHHILTLLPSFPSLVLPAYSSTYLHLYLCLCLCLCLCFSIEGTRWLQGGRLPRVQTSCRNRLGSKLRNLLAISPVER